MFLLFFRSPYSCAVQSYFSFMINKDSTGSRSPVSIFRTSLHKAVIVLDFFWRWACLFNANFIGRPFCFRKVSFFLFFSTIFHFSFSPLFFMVEASNFQEISTSNTTSKCVRLNKVIVLRRISDYGYRTVPL